MHPAEIQALLKKRGIKQADIARECEVSRTVVGDVIQGRRRSERIERRIIELTDELPYKLWPEWYGSGTHWTKQHEMLSRDESVLIRSYRTLSSTEKAEIVAAVQAMEAGFATGFSVVAKGSAGHRVTAKDSSIAAVGDVSVGTKSGKRK